MNILAKAEVHFHQQEQLSVYLESNSSGDLEKVGEIGLLTMFALRNLSNLGNSKEADGLGQLLYRAEEFVLPLASAQAGGGFELIAYPGHEGRKRFYATFRLRDDQSRLDMKPKGFGLLGFALGYYAPIAVLGLFRHLAIKRANDRDYLSRLAAAASACGRAKLRNEIGVANQVQLGGPIIVVTCGDLLDPEIQTQDSSARPTALTETQVKPSSTVASAEITTKSLPDTINPADEKYQQLGREFDENLGRSDGPTVAKSLHAHFEQDLRDWMYDQVWPYVSGIPLAEWSQNESMTAEWQCRNGVSFFQSIRGAAEASNRGYVPANSTEWYTHWLLRLNLGNEAAKAAMETWLPEFEKQDGKAQLQLFCGLLGTFLPEIKGLVFALNVYGPTLDLRIQATTARAFGDDCEAYKLHTQAAQTDERLNEAFDQYFKGGGVCYVLEKDQGLLITGSSQYGKLFHLWTKEDYAKEANNALYEGTLNVSPMSYRELEAQLRSFVTEGMHYVTIDRRASGDVRILPIAECCQTIRDTINAAETSELGIAIKRGLEVR